MHAKGVVLCERVCFCLLSAFYNTPPFLESLLRTLAPTEILTRCLLRTLLRSTSFEEPSNNPSKKRVVAWLPWYAPYCFWDSCWETPDQLPATGIQNADPRNSSKKRKIPPRSTTPHSLKKTQILKSAWKYSKCFSAFLQIFIRRLRPPGGMLRFYSRKFRARSSEFL